jgi:hypothetical protein
VLTIIKRDAIQTRVGMETFLGQAVVPLATLMRECEGGEPVDSSGEDLGQPFARVDAWFPLVDRPSAPGAASTGVPADAAVQLSLTLFERVTVVPRNPQGLTT